MSQQPTNQVVAGNEKTGCLGALVRLSWLLVGNAALFMLTVFIFQKRAFSVFDIAFWAIVIGLIILRYIDITRLKGLTSDAEPASLLHLRRYAVTLLVISGALWAAAHGIARLVGK